MRHSQSNGILIYPIEFVQVCPKEERGIVHEYSAEKNGISCPATSAASIRREKKRDNKKTKKENFLGVSQNVGGSAVRE